MMSEMNVINAQCYNKLGTIFVTTEDRIDFEGFIN